MNRLWGQASGGALWRCQGWWGSVVVKWDPSGTGPAAPGIGSQPPCFPILMLLIFFAFVY